MPGSSAAGSSSSRSGRTGTAENRRRHTPRAPSIRTADSYRQRASSVRPRSLQVSSKRFTLLPLHSGEAATRESYSEMIPADQTKDRMCVRPSKIRRQAAGGRPPPPEPDRPSASGMPRTDAAWSDIRAPRLRLRSGLRSAARRRGNKKMTTNTQEIQEHFRTAAAASRERNGGLRGRHFAPGESAS